ncbi:hypothetical protein Gpo141_00003873 [Globisporangium polare]
MSSSSSSLPSSSASSATRVKFTSPFAPLQLSAPEAESLEQLSRVILHNYVAQYEDFERARDGSDDVDEKVWKPVKQREDVRVFTQRKQQPTSNGTVATLKRALASFSNSGAVQPAELPVMLIIGTVAGTLDDLMYGVMSPTVETTRVKSTYVADHVADVAILATLAKSTQEDPFQSLVVKWVQNDQGRALRPAVSNRDFVYMERTGLAYTSAGERVGFHLLHSVHFPQTHEVQPFVRGNVSVCSIYRQKPSSGGHVQVYLRGILDARGSIIRPIVINAAADMFISVWKTIECSHLKKTLWRLARRKRQASIDGRDKKRPSSFSEDLGSCVTCKRTPSMAGGVLTSAQRRKCALCAKYVCSSCKIKKTFSQVVSPTAKLWQRELAFCTACYSDACRSDAFGIAQQELVLSEAVKELDVDVIEALSVGSDCYSPTNSE